MSKIFVGISGASGSIYAERLIHYLIQIESVESVQVVFSETAEKVCIHELLGSGDGNHILVECLKKTGNVSALFSGKVQVHKNTNLFAPSASGTNCPNAVVIIPASMGMMGRIANGISSNLIERTADVMLKQRRSLLICPRETPLSLIHLKNMTSLVEAGAQMIPLMPGFYNKPKTLIEVVDFCVGRILEQLGFSHSIYKPWNSN